MSASESNPFLSEHLVSRYLGILGVQRRPPDLNALTQIVTAHVTRVPFENISKLYRRKQFGFTGLSSIEMFLDGIERNHFGGTCYSNNFHFYRLLATLGYDVKLCSADMSNPDVHMVSMVRLEGREYLIDTGYAAPFLRPLPRDLAEDYVIALGRDRYVLKPQDAQGRSRLELRRDGVAKHGYLAKPEPRSIADFEGVITHSFRPGATFLNAVLLTRFYKDRSVVIHNLTLIESRGTECVIRRLNNRDELAYAAEEHFGIARKIVCDAIADLGSLEDAWG